MALSQLGGSHWSTSEAPSSDKENVSTSTTEKNTKANKQLTPTWIFNAAMLSNPVDLSALVAMSREHPDEILNEIGLLNKMVEKVLNAPAKNKRIDKDTRLDVLLILGNLSKGDGWAKEKIKKILQGVSSWFESYVAQKEGGAEKDGSSETASGNKPRESPELYKAMLLVLARTFEYNLRTEDLLELTGGNRQVALESVVGILEDGEMEVTELAQLAPPKEGQRGAWQQRVVSIKHEKPLILQMCSLLLGFTRADTYFSALDDGFYFMECGLELPEYCIEKFSVEIDKLLSITMSSGLVGKLAAAMNGEMFQESKVLDSIDHLAVVAVHSFLQNLYLFACDDTDEFRHHILCDTLFVPHLIVPYLDRCIYHAAVMTRRCAANQQALGEFAGYDANTDVQELVDQVSGLSLDYPELVSGMESTMRTLVICTFRAPRTRLMYQLLVRFNPTASLLRMKSFIARHDYLFFLLLVLNINCGSFDMVEHQYGIDHHEEDDEEEGHDTEEGDDEEEFLALAMLQEVLSVYEMMSKEQRMRVLRRVEMSGALPVARDTASYLAVLGVLAGSYVNSFSNQITPAFLLADEGYDDVSDDSLCLDGIGPDDDEDDDLALALKDLGGDREEDVSDYPNYGESHSALSGNDIDAMSETAHFKNSREQIKMQAEKRMQSKLDDDANEKLCMEGGGGGNPYTLYDTLSEKCSKIFNKSGKELMGETWCAEMNEMENEMDFLDSLVAADLTQCREELKALEAEVRMLQNGEDLDMTFDTDDEDEEEQKGGVGSALIMTSEEKTSSSPHSAKEDDRRSNGEKEVDDNGYKFDDASELMSPVKGALQAPLPSSLMGSFGHAPKSQSKEVDEDNADEKKNETHSDLAAEMKNVSIPSSVPNLQLSSMNTQDGNELAKKTSKKEKGKTPRVRTGRKNDGNLTARASARGKRSLLGDLPSLDKRASQQEIDTFLQLKLEVSKGASKNLVDNIEKKSPTSSSSSSSSSNVPKEFACAINGHCMRDPYISPDGIVFEKATIMIWLNTRGNVCPITHKPLLLSELKPDKELKTKIMRYHIAKSMSRQDAASSVQKPSSSSKTNDVKETSPLNNLSALGASTMTDDMYEF